MKPPKGEGPKKEIIQRLSFNEEQVVAYEKLIAGHQELVKAKEQEIRTAKNNLMASLKKPGNNSALEQVAKLHREMEEIHYQHFLDIRALCNEDQIPAFDSLVDDLAKMFAPKGMK